MPLSCLHECTTLGKVFAISNRSDKHSVGFGKWCIVVVWLAMGWTTLVFCIQTYGARSSFLEHRISRTKGWCSNIVGNRSKWCHHQRGCTWGRSPWCRCHCVDSWELQRGCWLEANHCNKKEMYVNFSASDIPNMVEECVDPLEFGCWYQLGIDSMQGCNKESAKWLLMSSSVWGIVRSVPSLVVCTSGQILLLQIPLGHILGLLLWFELGLFLQWWVPGLSLSQT